MHLAENFAQVGAGVVDGFIFQSGMDGKFTLQIVAQQLLIEAADVGQDRKLPFWIFDQTSLRVSLCEFNSTCG